MFTMRCVGVMSGTSLDGLDLVLVDFKTVNNTTSYQIIDSTCVSFPIHLNYKLKNCRNLSGYELTVLDREMGKFIGQSVKDFIGKQEGKVDLIASHGHTVFHEPENGLTLQIGSGINIFEKTNITTINDFRSLDVALGGQGAPLVPIGDRDLFKEFDACVNLGGIANISFDRNDERIAFDICGCNLLLNYLASQKGLEYDKDGELGKRGKLNDNLFNSLNALPYFDQSYPKSLGIEWIEKHQYALLNDADLSTEDLIASCYHHIAHQIAKYITGKRTLFTGGGAHNYFLMKLISDYSNQSITKASKELIDYKEALVFAYLGYLRIQNKNNVLSSVTGSKKDHSAGVIYCQD